MTWNLKLLEVEPPWRAQILGGTSLGRSEVVSNLHSRGLDRGWATNAPGSIL